MRRNLKTEIVMNKNKIHKLEDEIVRKKADYYLLKSENGPEEKIRETVEEITKLSSKIFQVKTHSMILGLHLDTAAPGQYPNQKYMKRLSRNSNLSKLSTFASTKINSGTHVSLRPNELAHLLPNENMQRNESALLNPKASGLTENEWVFRSSLHSIVDEMLENEL